MLTRLAGDLNVLANADFMEWTCCEQDFYHVNIFGSAEHWGWRFCNGGMPGEMFRTQPCSHWHHRHEPPPITVVAIPAR